MVHGLSLSELRIKYLSNLHGCTGRNIIAYYSGWLRHPHRPNLDINDSDMTGFMQCLKGVDCQNGLDLILHTPGGSPTAAEGIVNYLHEKFGRDIRVVVPQMAMSAGTMLACSAKSILMGKQSCLGPIDPQYGGVPAYNIKAEYEDAKANLDNNPKSKTYWEMQLSRYPSAFYYTVCDGIQLSENLAGEWLVKYMFGDLSRKEAVGKAEKILERLNKNNGSHLRHFGIEKCKELGFSIEELEADNKLQDAVLSVHHAFTITFDKERHSKIIMNHLGEGYFVS
ncbi:MAG: serine protease [Kiritimatiellae bacterium]|nr:serine protease [Kiritimatiellia bacterium]